MPEEKKKNTEEGDVTEVLMKESEWYKPSKEVLKVANVKNYEKVAAHAASDPQGFWAEAAKELEWFKPWVTVLDASKAPFYSWFKGGKCNIVQNALDRHQKTSTRDKAAIIGVAENGDTRTFTYRELADHVNQLAAGLRALGVKRGDRVSIYMPNIPEVAMAMLACAKLGAIHSLVYAGFSYLALRDRIQDAESKVVITADGATRRGKPIALKDTVDKAVAEGCPSVEHVVVCKYAGIDVAFQKGKDVWMEDVMKMSSEQVETEVMDAEDTLFILYTSGTTAKPKGIVHAHGGYMVGVSRTLQWVLDVQDVDVYWCTADPGWITGHSYAVYGPLMLGATTILYAGVPDYPQPDRIWSMVEEHNVTILYTAPTLVRMMMKYGDEWPKKHNMKSLRLLGSVGEPINPEAWRWFYKVVGRERCPIMDTWWQTEAGMFMIAPLPVLPLKPGSATKPFPGIQADVVDKDGKPVPVGKGGHLVIRNPWPAMLKTVYKNPKRYLETYWEKIPGVYLSGDIATKDKDGYFWIQGRSDDVMNISGHRIGSAEIESAFVSHHAVAEAGVIGKPHPVKGTVAKAFLILKKGFEPSDMLKDELKKHVRHTMGPLAIVEEIAFVDKLPKTRSGKIMRRVLKAQELGQPLGDVSSLED